MALTNKEVAEITGDTEEEIERITGIDDTLNQLTSPDMMKVSDIDIVEDGIRCDYPGCEASFSGVMAKAQLGRHKSAKHNIKKASVTVDNKPTQTTVQSSIIPTSETKLEAILKAFSVPSKEGIMLSMQDKPDDIHRLRDMLRAVSVPAGKIEAVTNLYSEYLGVKSENNNIVPKIPEMEFADKMMIEAEKKAKAEWVAKLYGGNSNNQPNHEMDALKTQMNSILETNKLLQQQLIENKRESEISELKKQNQLLIEQIKQNKDDADGQAGHLAASMKDFATNISHMLEKKELESTFTKELQAIQKKLDEQSQGKTATNAAELSSRVLDKTAELLSSAGNGFVKFNENMTRMSSQKDAGETALALMSRGVSPDQLSVIFQNNPVQPRNPGINAEAEWHKMAQAVATEPQPPMDVIEKASIGISKVKINGD